VTVELKRRNPWFLAGAVIAAAFGVFKLVVGEKLVDQGDGVAALLGALALLGQVYRPENFITHLRKFFKRGDLYARRAVLVIAIGGTLLTLKKVFDTHLIPDQIDFVFKRLAIPAVLITIVIYCTSVLSKLTFYAADVETDAPIRRYEAQLYWMVIAFSICLVFLAMGTSPLDELLGQKHNADELWFDPSKINWPPPIWRGWFFLSITSAIWMIYAASAVISRNLERIYRDRWSPTSVGQSEAQVHDLSARRGTP
jgi:hypothetical protein